MTDVPLPVICGFSAEDMETIAREGGIACQRLAAGEPIEALTDDQATSYLVLTQAQLAAAVTEMRRRRILRMS